MFSIGFFFLFKDCDIPALVKIISPGLLFTFLNFGGLGLLYIYLDSFYNLYLH